MDEAPQEPLAQKPPAEAAPAVVQADSDPAVATRDPKLPTNPDAHPQPSEPQHSDPPAHPPTEAPPASYKKATARTAHKASARADTSESPRQHITAPRVAHALLRAVSRLISTPLHHS